MNELWMRIREAFVITQKCSPSYQCIIALFIFHICLVASCIIMGSMTRYVTTLYHRRLHITISFIFQRHAEWAWGTISERYQHPVLPSIKFCSFHFWCKSNEEGRMEMESPPSSSRQSTTSCCYTHVAIPVGEDIMMIIGMLSSIININFEQWYHYVLVVHTYIQYGQEQSNLNHLCPWSDNIVRYHRDVTKLPKSCCWGCSFLGGTQRLS